jgi:hypothetical protein
VTAMVGNKYTKKEDKNKTNKKIKVIRYGIVLPCHVNDKNT